MILWAVLGGFGDSGFRYGRYCGLQTCRPVENDLLLLMRRTNVSWDVGDNSCLVDPCDLVACKGQAAVSNCTLQFDSKRAPFRGIHSVQYRCSYIQDTRTTCSGQIVQRRTDHNYKTIEAVVCVSSPAKSKA